MVDPCPICVPGHVGQRMLAVLQHDRTEYEVYSLGVRTSALCTDALSAARCRAESPSMSKFAPAPPLKVCLRFESRCECCVDFCSRACCEYLPDKGMLVLPEGISLAYRNKHSRTTQYEHTTQQVRNLSTLVSMSTLLSKSTISNTPVTGSVTQDDIFMRPCSIAARASQRS